MNSKAGAARFLLSTMVLALLSVCVISHAQPRTYTINADFDEGTLIGLDHNAVPDQLQLNPDEISTFPFIWLPNLNGTVSKISTETGAELARYRVVPPNLPPLPFEGGPNNGKPSRTTVGLDGSCWVGCRTAGTVVKIGLLESGQWIDRNGDGVVQTSRDTNGDGDISEAETLAWGEDECVLYELVIVPGHEGAYVPGTYTGPYDPDDLNGVCPRTLAVDSANNIWVGSWGLRKYFYVQGATGQILSALDVAPHTPYGSIIDRYGKLWSAGRDGNDLLVIDPSTNPATLTTIPLPHLCYGIGMDYDNHLFVTGFDRNQLTRVNILTHAIDWTKSPPGILGARGVVCTKDNDVWLANSYGNTVTRYDNDGNWKATIPDGFEPTGLAVDSSGRVWCCDRGDDYVIRIDPASNTIDIIKEIIGSQGHYTYSDMTGALSRTITTNTGTWTVIRDGGTAGTRWANVSWNDQPGDPDSGVYPNTSIVVRVQSSEDMDNWSVAETVASGLALSATPAGRYLRVEVTLTRMSGTLSPILYDLTVRPVEDNRHATLLEAYCGTSNGTNRVFKGSAGMGDDCITAVPGILCINPGRNASGAINWSNFVKAASYGVPYTVTNVLLKKEAPAVADCLDRFPGKTSYQQGTSNVRLWWPLMYEVPNTKWTLKITYRTATLWDYDGAGPAQPSYVHQDTWDWTVTATLESIRGALLLFHEVPHGMSQTPLISDEVLLPALLQKIATVEAFVANNDKANASEVLLDFIMTVEDACISSLPRLPIPTGIGTGIANTCENPACCKILADADYVGNALGLFQ